MKRNCGVNGCTRKHHPSIHENNESTPQQATVSANNESTPQQATASANVCNNSSIDTCFLQVQKVEIIIIIIYNNNLLIYSAPFSMEMIKGALHIQY